MAYVVSMQYAPDGIGGLLVSDINGIPRVGLVSLVWEPEGGIYRIITGAEVRGVFLEPLENYFYTEKEAGEVRVKVYHTK